MVNHTGSQLLDVAKVRENVLPALPDGMELPVGMIEGTTLQLDSIPRERLQPKQVVEHRAHTLPKGEESVKEFWTPMHHQEILPHLL
jgi:hypothetical protein